MVFGVRVTDVVERELAIEADEPTRKSKKKFRERRMDVEVVFSRYIVGCKLAKVYLIEPGRWLVFIHARVRRPDAHNLVWAVDFVKADR
jgi:hypothetical protein